MDSNDEKLCTEPSSSYSQKNSNNEDINENISEDEEETSHVICTSNIFSTVEYENCNDINSRNAIHNSDHNSSLYLNTFNSNDKANSSADHLHIGSTSSEIFSPECEMEVEKLNCDTLNSGFESLSNEKEHTIYLKHLNPLVLNVNKNSTESVSNQLNDDILNIPGTGKSFNGIGKKSLNKSYFQRVFNEESKQKDKVVNSSNKFSLFSLQLSKENKPNFNNSSNKSTLSYHVCDQENSNPGPSQFVVFEEENLHDLRDDVCIVESSSKIIPNINHALDLRHTESSSGDNCIVSSSTGHLDPIDFNEHDYHSSSTTSPLNPPILDSTVDSTSEQNPLVSPFSDDSEVSQKSEESDFGFSIYEHKRKMAITLSHKSENHDLNILADSHHSHHLEYQDSCQQPIVDNFLSLNNFNLQLQSSSMPDKSSDKLSSTFATLSSNYYIKNPECSSISESSKESLLKVKHYRNDSSVSSDSNIALSHESNFAYRDNSFESKSDKNLSEINNMALGISKIVPESSNLRAASDIENDVFSASCHELDISANNLTPGRTLTHLNERYLFNVEENSTSNDHALCLESIPEVGSKFNENLHVQNENLRDKGESLESCSKSEEAIMSNYQTTLELGLESHQLRDLINTRAKTNLDPSLLMDVSDDNESSLKMNNAVDCSTVDCDSPKVFLNYISSSPRNLSSQEATYRETCKNNLVDSNLQGDVDLIDEKSTNSREYFSNAENCVSNNESKLPYSCSEQKMLDIIFSKYNDQKRPTRKLEKTEEERNDNASLKEKGYIYSDRIGPPQKFMDNWIDSEIELENQNILENEGFWCADCEKTLKTKCSFHRIKPVLDKPVLSRARASLPAQHLTFKYSSTDVNKECCSGVLSRRSIPKRTQFGPLEGKFVLDSPIVYSLLFKVTQNNVDEFIDTSDEGSSNWMRFVRPANCQSEINCIVIEEEGQIYFLTTVHILPKTELRVWYSKQYALKYNFALMEDPDIDKEVEQRDQSCGSSVNNDEAISSFCNENPVRREKRRSCSKRRDVKPETSKQNVIRRLYDCAYCDLSFKENELLQLHSLEHSEQCVNDFHDDISGSVSESESSVDVHSNNAKCPSCFKEFDTMTKLTEHVRVHSAGVVRDCEEQHSFKCDLCYKTFSERSRLIKHAESHKSDSQKPFECSRCIRRFCNKSALGSHLKLHIQGKGAKLYNCPICCENFYAVVTFKAHLSVHLIKGEYTCPSCSKKFQSYHKIRRHIRSYHTAVHPCQECGKILPSVEKLKIHLLSHSDRRDFACPECSKRFKRKDKMKEHFKRIHSENNNNNNNNGKKKCGQKFVPKVDPADYKQFMYKCYLCLLGFKRRGMLVNHLAKRHPGIPIESVPELNQPIVRSCHSYMCQYCGKTYGSTTKRKLHILKNHPGAELPQQTSMRNEDIKTMKTFAASCPWCPRQYATKAKLLQHQRHHHHHYRPKNKEKVSRFKSQNTSESQVKDSPKESKDILSQALDKISNKPGMFGLNSENTVVEINVQSGQATNNQDYQKQNDSTSSCGEVYVSPFVVPREGTYAVLTPDGSETFTLSLRNGQILPSVGTISVLTPETVSSNVELVQGSPARLLTLDGLHGTQFSAEDVNCTKEDSCIAAQNESENTSVLIWQPSITYNPTS